MTNGELASFRSLDAGASEREGSASAGAQEDLHRNVASVFSHSSPDYVYSLWRSTLTVE